MRILLTGSNGYIGRHLESLLTINYGTDAVEPFDIYGGRDEWELEISKKMHSLYDVVIHAGAIRMPEYEKPDIFWWNYHCSKVIADFVSSVRPEPKLIFFSTCMAINPVSHYGWSKRCAADYTMQTLDNYCVVRPYTVYGREEGTLNKYSPVWRLVRGELPYCFNPWIRDYIHVQDLCAGIVHIIEKDLRGDYDLGRGIGISTMELVELWDRYRPPIVVPSDEGWPHNAPEALVARPEKMLPDFEYPHDVITWLTKLKATTLG